MALITDLDDRTLVERHRAGDADAFRRIVERHHRSLYRNALRRLGDPAAAEDAVQDAFIRAFRNLERFDGDYHLDAWLHRILTNTCHDIGRRRGRDTRLFDRACTEVDVDEPGADEALDFTPVDQITEALDSLPESYREVLVLRFVEELSYADVAEQAGISEENARARVSRGRNMLKRMLTSTSALVVWAIPSLRRQAQLSGAEAEAANQAAAQVHGLATIATAAPAPTQAFNQLSGIIAQAGPTIATAAPAVASSAPAFKAAVAVGIAATVAIPAGVAVDKAREKPVAPVAAEVQDETASVAVDAPVVVDSPSTPKVAGTVTGTDVPVVAASVSGGQKAVGATETSPASTPTSTTVTSPTSEPDTAPSPPSSEVASPTSPPPSEPTGSPTPAPTEPPPPAPVAGPPGQLSSSLAVTPSGSRLGLSGPMKLEVDGKVVEGQLSGKLLIGPAGRDPEAPRKVEGSDLYLDLADGNRLVLKVRGTSTVTTTSDGEQHELVLDYVFERAAEYGLAGDGTLEGTLLVAGETAELGLAIPGATEAS